MATIYKRADSRYYWAKGFDSRGKPWAESTKQTDPKAAELAARSIELRYAADPAGRPPRQRALTVGDALTKLVDWLSTHPKRSPATGRAATYHARHLLAHLKPDQSLESIRLSHTEDYVQVRRREGASLHTIKKEILTLTSAIRRAAKRGEYVMIQDPTHLVPDTLENVYQPRKRWLTREEYALLLGELSPDRQDYVRAYVHTGLRRAELFSLRAEHYVPARMEIHVPGTKTEAAARVVPLSLTAAGIVRRRVEARPEGPLFPEWVNMRRDLLRACKAVGIAPVTANDLRRSFASWLSNADVPAKVIADLMGHETTSMVSAVYGHISRERLESAIGQLDLSPKSQDPSQPVATAVTTEGPQEGV